jgi:DNA-directed RNA polymerase specialized sigma24 family protein
MPASASRTREHALRGLLLGTPRKVLARILPNDPLDLRQRVAAGLDRRALALDPDESHLAALARVAHAAPGWGGGEPLGGWLDRQVDAALDDLLREEAHAVREGEAVGQGPSVLRDLARPLEVGPEQLRAACTALNQRPTVERRAFVRIVLDREEPEQAARAEGISLNALACRARAALLAVLEAFEGTPWNRANSEGWPAPAVQESPHDPSARQTPIADEGSSDERS